MHTYSVFVYKHQGQKMQILYSFLPQNNCMFTVLARIFPGERRRLGTPRVRLLNQFLLFLHADWLAQNRDKVANENGYIS
jgi:hypothetical protein